MLSVTSVKTFMLLLAACLLTATCQEFVICGDQTFGLCTKDKCRKVMLNSEEGETEHCLGMIEENPEKCNGIKRDEICLKLTLDRMTRVYHQAQSLNPEQKYMDDVPCKEVISSVNDGVGCGENQYCVQARQKVFDITLGKDEDEEIEIPVCIDKSLWEEKASQAGDSTNQNDGATNQDGGSTNQKDDAKNNNDDAKNQNGGSTNQNDDATNQNDDATNQNDDAKNKNDDTTIQNVESTDQDELVEPILNNGEEVYEDDTQDNDKNKKPDEHKRKKRSDVAYYLFLVFFALFVACSVVTAKITYTFFSKYSLSDFKDVFS